MRRYSGLLFLIFLSVSALQAQEEPEAVKNAFRGTRLVSGQSANLASDGELLLLIQHRFGDISGGFYDFFGLDMASMRLGFDYGLGDHLNLGLGRSTWLKTYDVFAKYGLVSQTTDFPFSAVLSTGASAPTIRNYFPDAFDTFSDKLSWNLQFHLAKTFSGFSVQVSPGYLKTGYLPQAGENFSVFTLGSAASVHVSKKVSVNLEYLTAFNSNIPGDDALSLGVDIDTGGHLFQLVLSNNQRMFDQTLYTNTTGSLTGGHLFFGFNLVRAFNLKYKSLWTE